MMNKLKILAICLLLSSCGGPVEYQPRIDHRTITLKNECDLFVLYQIYEDGEVLNPMFAFLSKLMPPDYYSFVAPTPETEYCYIAWNYEREWGWGTRGGNGCATDWNPHISKVFCEE